MPLIERVMEASISLADGPPFEGGGDTVTLKGVRMSAKIVKAGGLSDSTMQLQVYGMSFSTMNRLSTFGVRINLVPKNAIVLTAGDAQRGLGTVFAGYILAAYADMQAAPDVSFNITAHTGLPDAVVPAKVSSFPGATDVATFMSSMAALMNLKFENNGVTAKLPSSYFYGSPKSQAQECVAAANIEWNGGDNGVLAIWPKNGSRGGIVPIISPRTGLVGYPTYTKYGVMLKTLFNPSIGFGQQVEVESQLPQANGRWKVYSLDHDLDCLMPHGQWFSMIGGHNPAHPSPFQRPAAP